MLLSGRPRRAEAAADAAQLEQLAPDATEAILVPLVFRGETLGVLAGINGAGERRFDEEDEQLLMSVAASAATAVATARSVAAARLRLSVEAADQARARWARELHDETLQGLTGVRMVLSAGLARDDTGALRGAAETADSHLGEEMRKLRDLIAELRPAALDDLGLGPAIESLAKRQAAIAGFAVEVDIGLDSERRLAHDTETAIYRIVQEGLSNAVKHARAGQVGAPGDAAVRPGAARGRGRWPRLRSRWRPRRVRDDRDARARAARRRPAVGPVVRRRPYVRQRRAAATAGVNTLWPARTVTVAWVARSSTTTTPLATRTSVPSQKSSVSHRVPSTVAAE